MIARSFASQPEWNNSMSPCPMQPDRNSRLSRHWALMTHSHRAPGHPGIFSGARRLDEGVPKTSAIHAVVADKLSL